MNLARGCLCPSLFMRLEAVGVRSPSTEKENHWAPLGRGKTAFSRPLSTSNVNWNNQCTYRPVVWLVCTPPRVCQVVYHRMELRKNMIPRISSREGPVERSEEPIEFTFDKVDQSTVVSE